MSKKLPAIIICFILAVMLTACGASHTTGKHSETNTNFTVNIVEGAGYVATAADLSTTIMDNSGHELGRYNPASGRLILDKGEVVPVLREINALKNYLADIKTVIIQGETKEICSDAFGGCTALTAVELNSVETIADRAFYNCNTLNELTIGEHLTDVSEGAFFGCNSLNKITIGSDVPANLFSRMTALSTLVLLDTVKNISSDAFIGCTALSNVTFGANINSVGDGAFSGCTALTEVNIEAASDMSIGINCFNGCTALRRVVIKAIEDSDAHINIGDYAFRGCTDLSSGVALDNGVVKIGKYVFSGCEGLRTVILGKTVKELGEGCYANTTISKIYFRGTYTEWEKVKVASKHYTKDAHGYVNPDASYCKYTGTI